jgi:DNA polymerase III delta prime subunit
VFIERAEQNRLFEAVTSILAKNAEKSGETCSRDAEAIQEPDEVSGQYAVRLRFWGTQPRNIQAAIRVRAPGNAGAEHKLTIRVGFSPGPNVICGRDSHIQNCASLILSKNSSSKKIVEEKALIKQWLQECCVTWEKPADGMVKVKALHQTSTDWIRQWQNERVKECKSVSGTGDDFYLKRPSLERILADAKLWASSSLRVYMISGPPGVGKSEFVIWLASKLGMSIYRLCLSSTNLTDDQLTQLLSQSAIQENAVLLQVDEFQVTVDRWLHDSPTASSGGITAGGFCEALQGSSAMCRGVVVLTGTDQLVLKDIESTLPGVYRRIRNSVRLDCMTQSDIATYFHNFLRRFMPAATDEDWVRWKQVFTQEEGPWSGTRNISIDMLKQYLMHELTEASCNSMGSFTTGKGTSFEINPMDYNKFFESVCGLNRAEDFLGVYTQAELQIKP